MLYCLTFTDGLSGLGLGFPLSDNARREGIAFLQIYAALDS